VYRSYRICAEKGRQTPTNQPLAYRGYYQCLRGSNEFFGVRSRHHRGQLSSVRREFGSAHGNGDLFLGSG